MQHFLLCLALLLWHTALAQGHELPDEQIERRVQVIVEPDGIQVQYTLAMNKATLGDELRKHELEPAQTLRAMWKQYERIILPLLSERMLLSVDGENSSLKPIRAEYLGWSHRHLVCYLRREVRLTNQSKTILLTDGNFPNAPGNYRIAMKGYSGAKMENPTIPALVSRAEPVEIYQLNEEQKEMATRAKAEFCIAATSTAITDELFPDELVHFLPYQRNPVFVGTGDDTWDHTIRERGCVLRHDGKWHLWYTGYKGEGVMKMLGYATSPDGLIWKRHPNNPVFEESWTEDVHVAHYAGKFYMVAEGRGDIAHQLTSPDGIKWTDRGRLDVRYRDGSPLSPGPYGTPTLWIEDKTWYLFYERGDRGVWLAQSTDRKTWTNLRDEPVITRGPDEYDRHAVALNQVVRYRGRYYGVYHANADPNWKAPWTTCLAVSDDLVHWKKYPDNPIVRTNNSSGQLVYDGQRYRLYTMHPDVRVFFPRDADSGM